MPRLRLIMTMLLAAAPVAATPVAAGAQGAGGDALRSPIIVTGQRGPGGKPIPMSDWHMAEGQHVVVFGKDEAGRLVRVARNLEALHFLLSVLLNRVDAPDETVKLSVTLIGDTAD